MKVVSIAGPFTAVDAYGIHCNVNRAEDLALRVARLGAAPLCPHTNTRNFHGTLTEAFWYAATKELMRRADAVVFQVGWQDSLGARDEHEDALERGQPIFYEAKLANLRTWLQEGSA